MKPRMVLLAAGFLVAIACDSSRSQAPVAVSAKGADVASATGTTKLDLGNGVVLDRVRVVIRRMVLEPVHVAADAGAALPCDDCCCNQQVTCHAAGDDGMTDVEKDLDASKDIVLGPLLVDLSAGTLAGGIGEIFSGSIPEGTYQELEVVVGPVTAAEAGDDAKLAEMAAQNASIIVEGSIDGAPFTFVSGLTADFEIEGDIVVRSGDVTNITVSLNVKRWFGGTGEMRCDPARAMDKPRIEKLIRAALHAFQDDDRDGHDDHHGNDHGADDLCDD